MPTLADAIGSLKNLGIGPDRADSGYSGQPYIKHARYSSDPTGFVSAFTHTAIDVVRMSKFLVDKPLFTAKQIGLQLMNPQVEHKSDFTTANKTDRLTKGQGFFNNVGNFTLNTANKVANKANQIQNKLGSNRVYTPVNFIAQIAGSAAGKHIPRQGFDLEISDTDKYPYIVKQNDKNKVNRLVGFTNLFIGAHSNQEGKKEMFSYTGGPNSFLGIGKTSISSYYSTFAAGDTTNPDSVSTLNGFRPIDAGAIFDIKDGLYPNGMKVANVDFRAYKAATDEVYAKEVKDKSIRITNYQKYNTHQRIGVINTNSKSFGEVANDGVNMVSLYYSQFAAGNVKDINGEDVNKEKIRDLIKFRIKAIDNDNPGKGVYMVFRAFLHGITDNMDATWNPVKYVGRGESFYAYDGFTSGYSLGFTIAAFSKKEMKPLYQKLNYLKSTMAPDYNANKMRGNVMEFTVGDYIKQQPGIITSLSITIPDEASWEIAMNEPDAEAGGLDKDMHELPQMLKVEMSFIPIYNFLPRKSAEAPFIGIDDLEADGKDGRPTRGQASKDGKEWLYGANNKLK